MTSRPDGVDVTIAAIETSYAGCRFRSRLEARWAVFLDALGLTWQYEPQGFELPSGELYLPDFRLPDHDLWVEVKGGEDEFRANGTRYAEAALHLGGTGLLVLGPIPDIRDGLPQHSVLTAEQHCCGARVLCLHIAWAEMLAEPDAVREYGFPCTDLLTHRVELPQLKGYGAGKATWTAQQSLPEFPLGAKSEAAYRAARSARFEHGESG